ncbi:MAG: hypothetical protein F6K09_22800 [Merismopedia sp. SIO2A8]|nr:hypothetical protein [Merismopedia sp. SIO2A8]
MVGILVALILAYESLGVGRVNVPWRRRWLTHIPFSLYLAWISVATIVNVACALFSTGLQSYSEVWTILMLMVGGGLAITMARQRVDTTFVSVFVWAYSAIALRHQADPWIFSTAIGVAIAMVGQLLLKLRGRSRFSPRKRR